MSSNSWTHAEAIARGWIEASQPKVTTYGKRYQNKEQESEEQTLLISWFEVEYKLIGKLLIHIPNGGSRKNAYEGWRLKQQGVRAGVSDLFLPVARSGFHGLWIEFKATPPYSAKLSTLQNDWLENMRQQGYAAHVAKGIENAKIILSKYLD